MQNWFICSPNNSVIDVSYAATPLDAIKQHCRYWGEPATPDQWNRYRALTEEEVHKYFWDGGK